MARKYSSSEVKALLRKHRELYARFGQLDALAQRSKAEIQAAASKITAESTAKLLETVDVDELSRRKKGIRVKSLHDAGFNTIADILRANSMQISSINGISPEGAKEIKRIAVSIANTAQRSAKIRLSADDKNDASTALVIALFKYKRLLPAINISADFRSYYGSALSKAVSDAKPATGGLAQTAVRLCFGKERLGRFHARQRNLYKYIGKHRARNGRLGRGYLRLARGACRVGCRGRAQPDGA